MIVPALLPPQTSWGKRIPEANSCRTALAIVPVAAKASNTAATLAWIPASGSRPQRPPPQRTRPPRNPRPTPPLRALVRLAAGSAPPGIWPAVPNIPLAVLVAVFAQALGILLDS